MPFRYYPPDSLPVAFDIVFCRYPYWETPDEPAPIKHPTIIRQPLLDENGNPHVRVIYGTSQDTLIRGYQYFTTPDWRRCGLSKPTRFCLDTMARVPWSEEYFDASRSGTPHVSRLSADALREFQIALGLFLNR